MINMINMINDPCQYLDTMEPLKTGYIDISLFECKFNGRVNDKRDDFSSPVVNDFHFLDGDVPLPS